MGRGDSATPIGGDGSGSSIASVLQGVGPEGGAPLAGADSLAAIGPGVASSVVGSVGGFVSGDPGSLSMAASGLLPRPIGPQEPQVHQRLYGTFNVLGFRPEDGIITEVYVEDTCGFELPVAKVVLRNYLNEFSSTSKAREQTSFTVVLGFIQPGTEVFGPFIVQRPMWRFSPDKTCVEVVGYGEAVKLGAKERREVYEKMTDEMIAAKIAGRNGFGFDGEATEPVHEKVLQANESDYKFLAKRAKLYGFMLYVERGVLHFHRPRPKDSGYKLTIFQSQQPNLVDVMIHSRTFLRGLKLKLTQIDPLTKEEINETSSEEPDPVQSATGFTNWAELTTIPGPGRPERFITNEGHEQQKPVLKKMVDRMAPSTRYVISGVGNCVGLEKLRAKDLITLENIGRSSGKYFVTRVIHRIRSFEGNSPGVGGYHTTFEVTRAGAGGLGSAHPLQLERESIVSI